MARRKAKRRSRRKTFSILNGLEALADASILSEGITGGSLAQLIRGEGALAQSSVYDSGLGTTSMTITGATQISLADIVSEPSLAISAMGSNFTANIFPMAFAGFTTSVGFSIGRKLLRKPLSSVTRNLIHPVFGKTVRM